MNSLNDINNITKTLELLETENEVLYEVVEKRAPENKFTFKVFKNTPHEYPALAELLYRTHSDHPLTLGLKVFPKLFSSFRCVDKVENKVCDCMLFEHVPSYLRILYKTDFENKTGTFPKLYRYYQSFLDALGYLEIKSRFHGNLCPEVIGVTDEKALKFMELENTNRGIGDLNSSKLLIKDEKSPYLAPELRAARIAKKPLKFNGNKADVFAMGVILLELAGIRVEEGGELEDLGETIQEWIQAFREKFDKEVPFSYRQMFEKMVRNLEWALQVDPVERPNPLELLKKSMQFINKKHYLSFLKTIEENLGEGEFLGLNLKKI